MVAAEIVNTQWPVLEIVDGIEKALGFMEEYKVSHYPVVNGALLVGVVFEDDLYEISDWSLTLAQSKVRIVPVSVNENSHFLTVVNVIKDGKLSCIPVANEKNVYQGVISRWDIVDVFGDSSIVSDLGGVVEIKLTPVDYYLAEISKIIESTGVKILGTYIRTDSQNNLLYLTVKLNKQEIEDVLAALDRFGYTVSASYQRKFDQSNLKDRFDNLMYMLNL